MKSGRRVVVGVRAAIIMVIALGAAWTCVCVTERYVVRQPTPEALIIAASPSGKAVLTGEDGLGCELLVLDFHAPPELFARSGIAGMSLDGLVGRSDGATSLVKVNRSGWPLVSALRCGAIAVDLDEGEAGLLETQLVEVASLAPLVQAGTATAAQLARHRELVLAARGTVLAELDGAGTLSGGSGASWRPFLLPAWNTRAVNILVFALPLWLFLELVRCFGRRVGRRSRPRSGASL